MESNRKTGCFNATTLFGVGNASGGDALFFYASGVLFLHRNTRLKPSFGGFALISAFTMPPSPRKAVPIVYHAIHFLGVETVSDPPGFFPPFGTPGSSCTRSRRSGSAEPSGRTRNKAGRISHGPPSPPGKPSRGRETCHPLPAVHFRLQPVSPDRSTATLF